MKLADILGKNLMDEGFTVQEMTEVFSVNEDGLHPTSKGFFKDENIAKAFAEGQDGGASYNKTGKKFVLTNGETAFVIDPTSVVLLNDEAAALEVRKRALEKLTPSERALLRV